jgi:SnoaL-like protein
MLRLLPAAVLLAFLMATGAACAEDVPLETCDRLPVLHVSVSGRKALFLVDTAATSMLNLKSFTRGDRHRIFVTSWSGTVETNAQSIMLDDLAIGEHHLKDLKLPALDLSSIGEACGRRIDGILGVDLLRRLGATLDLKNQTAHLSYNGKDDQAAVAELHQQLSACEQAFNRADQAIFADCLSPGIVLFAAGGDFYGREAAMNYYRKRYFQQSPPARLAITPRGHHPIGDAMWMEYDMRIEVRDQVIVVRGTALCEKTEGKWRIVHMNHSAPPPLTGAGHAEKPQDPKF